MDKHMDFVINDLLKIIKEMRETIDNQNKKIQILEKKVHVFEEARKISCTVSTLLTIIYIYNVFLYFFINKL